MSQYVKDPILISRRAYGVGQVEFFSDLAKQFGPQVADFMKNNPEAARLVAKYGPQAAELVAKYGSKAIGLVAQLGPQKAAQALAKTPPAPIAKPWYKAGWVMPAAIGGGVLAAVLLLRRRRAPQAG